MAKGGIVTRATTITAGEAGPEAIIPLSRLNSELNNAGQVNTFNISIEAGFGAGGKDIGDAIVNELIRYQRRNGKVPVRTL